MHWSSKQATEGKQRHIIAISSQPESGGWNVNYFAADMCTAELSLKQTVADDALMFCFGSLFANLHF